MSDLSQLPDAARECVEAFAEQSRMALDPVRDSFDRFWALDVRVTFAMVVRGLNRHARKIPGDPGRLCWALASYLAPMEGTQVAEKFDLAVASGVPPVDLLEEPLGCMRETVGEDDSVAQHEIVVGRPSQGRTQSLSALARGASGAGVPRDGLLVVT